MVREIIEINDKAIQPGIARLRNEYDRRWRWWKATTEEYKMSAQGSKWAEKLDIVREFLKQVDKVDFDQLHYIE